MVKRCGAKYRTRSEILLILLEEAREWKSCYRLGQNAGLNHLQTKKYVGALADENYLEKRREDSEERTLYKINDKGLGFLKILREASPHFKDIYKHFK